MEKRVIHWFSELPPGTILITRNMSIFVLLSNVPRDGGAAMQWFSRNGLVTRSLTLGGAHGMRGPAVDAKYDIIIPGERYE